MPLSWNEIKTRAVAFSHKWKDEFSEDAEAKSFLDDFFEIFGVSRKRVATFEHKVKKLEGGDGYIDLLWKGTILVEHKSLGKSLIKGEEQARNYLHGLKDSELPRLLLMCDFQNFRLVDILDDSVTEFKLAELHNHVHLFGFMIGYVTKKVSAEDPVNIKAAEKMGALHDTLKEAGYEGHQLELLLVRLLFCLFAEDTGIFSKRQFQEYIEQRTAEDGSDLGMHLTQLFQVLDTPSVETPCHGVSTRKRAKNLDEQLNDFPYINGSLFTEMLPIASFDRGMRDALMGAATLDWSRISPAIFGSLFQSVMNPKERRSLGAHYTSETNILKLIGPLFLDDLRAEFELAKKSDKKLDALHKKIASLSFLDPACGCGNFLIIAYRELRKLEQDIIRELYRHGQQVSDISLLLRVTISQFHGIEIEEFPARIAEVALWLMDHQMNLAVSEEFGEYFVRIPLSKVDTVVCDNALRASWPTVDFILGNPPFLGSKMMSEEQRTDILSVADNLKNAGVLDFVTGWYLKASRLIAGTKTRAAFVSTNSICQGEQVGILWGELLERRNMQIHFAHRTFRWNNDARGVAAVHCVIVGFGAETVSKPVIFDYPDLKGDPVRVEAKQINGYLVDAPILSIENRSKPICDIPLIGIGNKPIDGGYYLFTTEEKNAFIAIEPNSNELFHKWIGAEEFLNGGERWVLLVQKAEPSALKKMPEVLKRIDAVKQYRLASTSAPTRKIADTPTRFHVENFPESTFLVIPEISSEKRNYIPIGFMEPDTICSNLVKITSEATPYHFGILSSVMHNAWMRTVAGRLESRYRYSSGIVYNNFPWPTPTDAQKSKIETCAQAVLDARAEFPTSTLADLYDPLTMPPVLLKAHQQLDKAVDSAYGNRAPITTGNRAPIKGAPTADISDECRDAPCGYPAGTPKFKSESERVAFLFERYRELVGGEISSDKPKATGKKAKSKSVKSQVESEESKEEPWDGKDPRANWPDDVRVLYWLGSADSMPNDFFEHAAITEDHSQDAFGDEEAVFRTGAKIVGALLSVMPLLDERVVYDYAMRDLRSWQMGKRRVVPNGFIQETVSYHLSEDKKTTHLCRPLIQNIAGTEREIEVKTHMGEQLPKDLYGRMAQGYSFPEAAVWFMRTWSANCDTEQFDTPTYCGCFGAMSDTVRSCLAEQQEPTASSDLRGGLDSSQHKPEEMLYPAGMSQCIYCTRWKGKGSCEAFPEEKSVPMKILTNEHDHRLEYPGDRGVRFDPSSEQGDQWQKKSVELVQAAKLKGLGKQ